MSVTVNTMICIVVTRWEPNAQGRLADAAFALYAERGFENTTVAEIAERAGLTERTFFRHFADKREVLFAGSEVALQALVNGVADAPDSATPLEAVAVGLEAVSAIMPERVFAQRRRQIIATNPELQERELIKLAKWASSITEALRRRGVSGPIATLTGQVGVAVFRTAFERWVEEGAGQDLHELLRESLGELRAVAAPSKRRRLAGAALD